jgi:hypothetical protein
MIVNRLQTLGHPARFPLLVDTGTSDPFLTRELRPEALEAAAEKAGFPITSRLQVGERKPRRAGPEPAGRESVQWRGGRCT